jgi:hypothetical protein
LRAFYLIAFPLIFLIGTGFIYTGIQVWETSCGGDVTCSGAVVGNIPTNNPLFSILSGQWQYIFSSVQTLSIGSGDLTIPLPTFGIPYPGYTFPLFGFTWQSWGTCPVCFAYPFPSFTCPLSQYSTWAFCPLLWNTWYPFGNPASWTIPGATAFVLGLLAGVVMIILGSGVSIVTAIFGLEINPQGTKFFQVVGIGFVVWSLVGLFSGGDSWLASLPGGAGTVVFGFLELLFALGVYWQTQSRE